MPVLLRPFGFLYGKVVETRFALTTPYRSRLPVVCVGNFTVGGAGKTPLAMTVARRLREAGRSPVFLTRGYGGRLAGPVLVDPERHNASDVGDEPLLLARHAPVVVARDRPAGAKFIETMDAGSIVMDDGFQNPTLAKTLNLIAIDAAVGLGNGLVFPAGPLRARLAFQLARTDMICLLGDGDLPAGVHGKPVVHAHLRPAGGAEWLKGRSVVAYCGIGRPEKFFETLRRAGGRIAEAVAFADHKPYTEADARMLLAKAAKHDAQLVTTEKDFVRVRAAGEGLAELRLKTRVVFVEIAFSEGHGERLDAALRSLAA